MVLIAQVSLAFTNDTSASALRSVFVHLMNKKLDKTNFIIIIMGLSRYMVRCTSQSLTLVGLRTGDAFRASRGTALSTDISAISGTSDIGTAAT